VKQQRNNQAARKLNKLVKKGDDPIRTEQRTAKCVLGAQGLGRSSHASGFQSIQAGVLCGLVSRILWISTQTQVVLNFCLHRARRCHSVYVVCCPFQRLHHTAFWVQCGGKEKQVGKLSRIGGTTRFAYLFEFVFAIAVGRRREGKWGNT
jgi:hypothetical protein